jgi:hypothetical protein
MKLISGHIQGTAKEVCDLYRSPGIVRMVKQQKVRRETRNPYRILM